MATKIEMLGNVTVLIGDSKAQRASQLADGLRDASFGTTLVALSIEEVKAKLDEGGIDVAVLSDTLGSGVFQLIRDVRHNRVGRNPFVAMLCALAPEHVDGAKHALRAGVDNILVHPVPPKDVTDRVRKISRTQTMYVVTSEYIGPDRRAGERSSIRRFHIPQTLTDRVRGKKMDYQDFEKEIAPIMKDMLQTRISMQASRLTMICKELIGAYATSQVTPIVKEKLIILCEVLRDAKATALQLQQKDVAELSSALGARVFDFAERYTQPTEQDINLIRKLGEQMGVAAKTGMAIEGPTPQEEERDLACPDLDEPALEIQFITKGQTLFKDGDPAIAAYVVAAGCIGIFRKIDGKNAPVGRIRKGEFFGEMAILDGSPRRATAVALEDTTLSLVSKESLEEKMEACDKLIRTILLTSIHNVRSAHENYTQRARSLHDMLESIGLSRHVAGRFIDRLKIKEEDEDVEALLSEFDAKYAEVVSACAPAVAKDRRSDQILTEEEINSVEEQ